MVGSEYVTTLEAQMAFRGSIIAAMVLGLSLLPLLASCAQKPEPAGPGDPEPADKNHADHAAPSHDDSSSRGGYSPA
jgi:hypothetical protein